MISGKNFGSYLFNQAIAYCRNMKFNKVYLYTAIEQKPALSMYGKAGFILNCEGESQSEWSHLIQERKYVLDFMKQQ